MKSYIGHSTNLHKRSLQHFSELRDNKHCNHYLQAAYHKYGESNFHLSILENLPSGLSELDGFKKFFKKEII